MLTCEQHYFWVLLLEAASVLLSNMRALRAEVVGRSF